MAIIIDEQTREAVTRRLAQGKKAIPGVAGQDAETAATNAPGLHLGGDES